MLKLRKDPDSWKDEDIYNFTDAVYKQEDPFTLEDRKELRERAFRFCKDRLGMTDDEAAEWADDELLTDEELEERDLKEAQEEHDRRWVK